MATKTLYFLATAAASPDWNGSIQDGGSAPTAANTGFGWGPAKNAVTSPYYKARLGASATVTTANAASQIASATGPTVGTGATNTTAGDTFSSPTPYTGTFAAGAWTISPMLRAGVAGCIGHLNMRVWASTAVDASSGVRELTSGSLVGTAVTLSTSADVNGMGTTGWSPGAITLNNEYIFFQFEWQETTAGSSNTDTVFFRVGTALITTTNFVVPLNLSPGAAALTTTEPTPSTAFGPSFAPATVSLRTTNIDVLLLHCDGANNSTVFTDTTGRNTVTPIGGVNIDTSKSVFGGASANFLR